MSKYRKKQAEIVAVRIFGEVDFPDEIAEAIRRGTIVSRLRVDPILRIMGGLVEVSTVEGVMRGNVGDWIVADERGHFRTMTDDLFTSLYEPAQ